MNGHLNIFKYNLMAEPPKPPQENDLKLQDLTREELKKIQKSMKKPEFMGLLNQYMVEISDPKNKNQYDEYLKQMEREKELPKHMKIVQLKPNFCFRTFIVSAKNKKHEMKFFVNMCQTIYLQKPSCEPSPGEDGKIGYSWKIPNSMGKIRYDQDKHGNPCQVADIAFHPDTFRFAARKEFQEMMIAIALEAAEKQLGERKETLSKDYVILKNVKCKGQDGKPALLPIRYIEGKMYNKGEGPTDEPERDNEGKQTKLMKEINKQKQQHDKSKLQQSKKSMTEREEEKEEFEQKQELIVDLGQGVQRPKFTSIYTYPIDYSEFIDNPMAMKAKKTPSMINIQFQIPRVSSMEEITKHTLEINDKKILFIVADKYFIDLELAELKIKYLLLTENAKAKFDKKKKTLRIVIPIDQTINYHPQEELKQPDLVQEAEQTSIVEQETWKNKVLEFTEPGVSVKILHNQDSKEPEKKLIEEIDEDDVTSKQNNTESFMKKNDEEDEDPTTDPAMKFEKFSLKKYYMQELQKDLVSEVSQIEPLFQQTIDKVVLVFQLKNYKKQEITITYDEELKRQFFFEWNRNQHSQENSSLISVSHLKISEEHAVNIETVEIVFRVGFVALMIGKKSGEKGKFWEKKILQTMKYEDEADKSGYEIFQQKKAHILQINQRRKNILAKAEEEIVEKQTSSQEQEPTKARINKSEVNQQSEIKSTELSAEAHLNQPDINANVFSNLQPQFLLLNVPFIDQLD